MRLRLLGFCGVDDSVDPRRMLALSRSNPFVEWGVLVRSEAMQRVPMYPPGLRI